MGLDKNRGEVKYGQPYNIMSTFFWSLWLYLGMKAKRIYLCAITYLSSMHRNDSRYCTFLVSGLVSETKVSTKSLSVWHNIRNLPEQSSQMALCSRKVLRIV